MSHVIAKFRDVTYHVVTEPDGSKTLEMRSHKAEAFDVSDMVADRVTMRAAGIVSGGRVNPSKLEPTDLQGVILKSPNGERWALQVSNLGTLSAVEIS